MNTTTIISTTFLIVLLQATATKSGKQNNNNNKNFQINFPDCTLSIKKNLGEPQPLLLKPDHSLYLPDDNGNFTLKKGEIINVTCFGGNVIFNSAITNQTNLAVKCISDLLFEVNRKEQNVLLLNCTQSVAHFARQTGRNCSGVYNELEIRFNATVEFESHLIVCFDDVLKSVLYSWYNLTAHIGGRSSFGRDGDFSEGVFYNLTLNVNVLYIKKTQARTINRLLGLSNTNQKYVNQSSANFFLARGHLTANRDFVYDSQQRSTFYYVNAAPQWQCFNNGNWKTLEENLRSFASKQKLDLVVYTGTYGISTLPHEETGEETQLFLYVTSGRDSAIPVPKFFWKFVYEPKSKNGTVFVGTNNPYKSEKEFICKDISDAIKWLTWKKDDQISGYSYACAVDDFRKVVNYLPEFKVQGLLTGN